MSDTEDVTTRREDEVDTLIREADQIIQENRFYLQQRKRESKASSTRNQNQVNPSSNRQLQEILPLESVININISRNEHSIHSTNSNANDISLIVNSFSSGNIVENSLPTNSLAELPPVSIINITTNDRSNQSSSNENSSNAANLYLQRNIIEDNSEANSPVQLLSVNYTTQQHTGNDHTNQSSRNVNLSNINQLLPENTTHTSRSQSLMRTSNNNMDVSQEDDIIFVGSTILNRNEIPINTLINLTENSYDDDEVICVGDISPPKRFRASDNGKTQFVACPVCLEAIENKSPVSTICGHVFCVKCLTQAMKIRLVCPLCQKKLKKNDWHHIFLSYTIK